MARLRMIALLLPTLAYAGPDEYRDLVKQVIQNMVATGQTMSAYSYVRKVDRKELNSDGKVKAEVHNITEHCSIDGVNFAILRQRDGKPVNNPPCSKSNPNIQKKLTELQRTSIADREKARKLAAESNDWLKEVHLALDCSKTGEEAVGGKNAIWLSCEPHPGYSASNMRAKMLEKIRAKLLVDPVDAQMIRTDAEIFEPISVAWGVAAKIAQGTRFHLERQKLPDGSWVNQSQDVSFAARVLLKNISQEEHTQLSDFRRP